MIYETPHIFLLLSSEEKEKKNKNRRKKEEESSKVKVKRVFQLSCMDPNFLNFAKEAK